jgi:branched-chain amino acid transport system ATP-binding protein
MTILEARDVSVRFGGHMAVNGVDLAVEPGGITGLIGPNGAGKTTTFNVITGLQPTTRGIVRLDGVDITGLSAHRRARAGIARTFQRLELFGSLSVRDNVRTAAELRHTGGLDPDDVADRLLDRCGIAELADQRADAISTGSARLVELARAMACAPRVLLLDEPASGLDEHETDRFAEILVDLAGDGIGILIVEHDVPLVMRLCHTITVLNFGEVIASGTPDVVQQDQAVIDAYLGQDPGAPG